MNTSSWLGPVLVVVAAIAFMLFRERWRMRAIQSWASRRQFDFIFPFVPEAQPLPAKALSEHFTANGAIRWGPALCGEMGGARVWLVDYESSRPNMTSAWFTLVAWPVPDDRASIVMDRPPRVIGVRSGFAAFRVEGGMTPSRIAQIEGLLAEIRETRLP